MAHMPLQMDDSTIDRLGPLMEECLEVDKKARRDWIENLQGDHKDLVPYLQMIFQQSYSRADGDSLHFNDTNLVAANSQDSEHWATSLVRRYRGSIALAIGGAVVLTATVGIGVTVIAALAVLNGIGGYLYYHYGRTKPTQ
jgi:hypothetical protein